MFGFALITAAVLSANPAVRPLVFGSGRHWVVMNDDGSNVEKFDVPAPFSADSLSASDRTHIFFTGTDPERGYANLFRLDRDTGKVTRIGDAAGRHSDVRAGSDGWIYFAHSPNCDGPPGKHSAGANAQIYRVKADGTQLAALSSGGGCHLNPGHFGRRTIFVYTHCTGVREFNELTREGQRGLSSFKGNIDEFDLSNSGREAVFSSVGVDKTIVSRVNLNSGAIASVVSFASTGIPAHPQYGRDGEIYYQDRWSINRVTAAGRSVHVADVK